MTAGRWFTCRCGGPAASGCQWTREPGPAKVCTGRNANVFYEPGLAEVLGHKPILIAAAGHDLPFDMAHWRCQMYAASGQEIGTLADRLRRAMEETVSARSGDPQPDVTAAPSTSTGPATEKDASVQSGPTARVIDTAAKVIDTTKPKRRT